MLPKISPQNIMQKTAFFFILFFVFTWEYTAKSNSESEKLDSDYSTINPQTIPLDLPSQQEASGGLITVDINNDSHRDFIVTQPGHIAVYNHSGKKFWTKAINIQVTRDSNREGLPGLHGPGIQAADIDGDQKIEILFLTTDNALHVVQGVNGKTQQIFRVPSPEGTERWEHLVISNFRGKGDRDILLQATKAEGYRMDSYLAAYSLDDLRLQENPQPLWTSDDFVGNAHNGVRVADLDRDGRDEVLGGTIISPEGEILTQIPLEGHIDSLFVADIRPDIEGLEVVALEEGGQDENLLQARNIITRIVNKIARPFLRIKRNRIFLYNHEKLIWETDYKRQEPQNATVGDFDPNRPGLEIWCRSRYDDNQKPFVFDAQGRLIANYNLNKLSPKGWTTKGVEVIFSIDWTGHTQQLAAAKERHTSGDVAIFNPMTGKFIQRFQEQADRLYVADVSGDWGEEVIVLNGNQLHIYSNPNPNPNPDHPQLWNQNHYRRSKMTWNYYSP